MIFRSSCFLFIVGTLVFMVRGANAEGPALSLENEAALPIAPQVLDGFQGVPIEPFIPEKSKRTEWKVPIVKTVREPASVQQAKMKKKPLKKYPKRRLKER